MRKNIPAADIIEWANDGIRAATKEITKPLQTQQRTNQLNGQMEAYLEIIDLCKRLQETEKDLD